MVVPWTGFPLKDLLALAKPLSSAKYVRMETFLNPEMAPGQRPSFLGGSMPWPYVEGVTMAEAASGLTFMVTAPMASRSPNRWGRRSG